MITWQYLAGLFDGEGCIHIQTNQAGRPHLRISISQANSAFLNLIKSFTGLGEVYSKSSGVQWEWMVTHKEQNLRFLIQVAPFLILKKAEAELAIQLCNVNRLQGRHASPKEKEKQDELATAIRATMERRKTDRNTIQEVM